MDTKPLERFATQARRDLLSSVDARATAVLAAGSVARAEWPEVVRKLEAEITAHGREHVIDKVAYTWFNRIIALRFMDARGYTAAGIVSPAQGQSHGQPEILAEAKRGNLDADVVNNKTAAETILSLLDGTRRSTDAEGEAYALLLTEYCRRWHKSMPFMFEREGDYTELLVPAGLLADGAILSRAREVLTEDVCDDVEVIGWLYQFYISERKDEVFASFKKNKKAGADEIPAATQLFTPHWIVRYLVENSLGRLWMLNRPTSRLVDQMEYYLAPVDEETDFLKIKNPEELTVIDPACGSGHMLTYAFDLLYAIYEEEGYAPSEIPSLILTRNLHGTEIDPRAGALAAFALTMKARAKQRTFFGKNAEPKICVIEPIAFRLDEMDFLITKSGDRHVEEAFWNQFEHADIYGALIQPDRSLLHRLASHLERLDGGDDLVHADTLDWALRVVRQARFLSPGYAVLVANPPYMGGGNMGSQLADFAKRSYPESKNDLFAMFIERSFTLLEPYGYSAMVTMESWMFLKSFKDLRESLVQSKTIENLLHMPYLGKGSTSMGINFGTVAAVVRNAHIQGLEATFQCVRYFETDSDGIPLQFPVRNERTASLDADRFAAIPGMPIAYWFPDQLLKLFESAPTISDVARAAKGLVTADNASFVREWWEVSSARITFGAADRAAAVGAGSRWFPYAKGGEFRRWAGNLEAVVNWENDGRALQTTLTPDGSRVRATNFNLDRIFKPSIAWTVVTSGALSFRQVGQGFLFDAAAGMCQGADSEYLLGLLNSDAAAQVLHGLNPTLNLHPGYLESVPMPEDGDRDLIRGLARRAVEISTRDWDSHERSWDFVQSPLVGSHDRLEAAIDGIREEWARITAELRDIEEANNDHFGSLFGLGLDRNGADTTSLSLNPDFAYAGIAQEQRVNALTRDLVGELVSYAVGCMLGRYSLDEPGLILADQGATLQTYLAKVSTPRFTPDADNVIPFVDDGWFEDDVVERFRQFLRVAFGMEHFEDNLHFVEESLGVKTLRDYFITKAGKSKFYEDHVQRYKKRPIYWMFSSPKGSFNALIYMHRYNSSTVSTVLNEYLREYRAKLEVTLANAERAGATGSSKDQKEADRLRKVLTELSDYEHDVLYPLATQQIAIDLDDGVKANYPKFYPAVRKIVGLEAVE